MSRMFHRALAVSVIGAAALALPATAMAADSGGAAAETATSVVIHLPQRAQPGEPFTVTARIIPRQGVATPGAPDSPSEGATDGSTDGSTGPGDSAGAPDSTPDQPIGQAEARGRSGGTDTGQTGTGQGAGKSKGTGHRKGKGHRKGTNKGKKKSKRHTMTGEVTFTLDGKAQPPVPVSRDQAVEEISVPLGRHTISAEYSGDSYYQSADSTTVTFALTDGAQQTDNVRR